MSIQNAINITADPDPCSLCGQDCWGSVPICSKCLDQGGSYYCLGCFYETLLTGTEDRKYFLRAVLGERKGIDSCLDASFNGRSCPDCKQPLNEGDEIYLSPPKDAIRCFDDACNPERSPFLATSRPNILREPPSISSRDNWAEFKRQFFFNCRSFASRIRFRAHIYERKVS